MSRYFEWISDNEDQWDQWDLWEPSFEQIDEEVRENAGPIEKILVGLTLFAILCVFGVTAKWGVDKVIYDTSLRLEKDVLSAHQVVQNAAPSGDVESFSLVLSRQNKQWHNIQRVLVRRRLFYDRAPLGLWLDSERLPEPRGVSLADTNGVGLSPDLEMAEITTLLPYVSQQSDRTLEKVWLRRTDFYQQIGEQWLLIPNDRAGYWGQQGLVQEGEILTVIYPERDRDLVLRLAQNLDAALLRLCQMAVELDCQKGEAFRLDLSTDPATLLNLNNVIQRPEFLNWRSLGRAKLDSEVALPTPGLIGYPVDEAAYQALLCGYAGWLATAFIYHQSMPQPLPFADVADILAGIQLSPPPPGDYNPFLAVEPVPTPFPEQEIELLCSQEPATPRLWRYDPTADTWSSAAAAENCDAESCATPVEATFSRFQWLADPSFEIHLPALNSDRLLDALPFLQKPRQLQVEDAAADPIDSERLFILASATDGLHDVYLYSYDRRPSQLSFIDRWRDNGYRAQPMLVSGNGRFLAITRYSSFNTYITIYDIEGQTRRIVHVVGRPYSRSDWSDDGRWLVIAAERMLWLIVPDHDYARPVLHNIAGCWSATWVGPA